jgi:hypothetical protein
MTFVILHCQPLAALPTATGDHPLASLSAHSGQKAMNPFPSTVMRLIGSFQLRSPHFILDSFLEFHKLTEIAIFGLLSLKNLTINVNLVIIKKPAH